MSIDPLNILFEYFESIQNLPLFELHPQFLPPFLKKSLISCLGAKIENNSWKNYSTDDQNSGNIFTHNKYIIQYFPSENFKKSIIFYSCTWEIYRMFIGFINFVYTFLIYVHFPSYLRDYGVGYYLLPVIFLSKITYKTSINNPNIYLIKSIKSLPPLLIKKIPNTSLIIPKISYILYPISSI